MDQCIEDLVKGCLPCQSSKNAPAVAPLHPGLDLAYQTMEKDPCGLCWSLPWENVHHGGCLIALHNICIGLSSSALLCITLVARE